MVILRAKDGILEIGGTYLYYTDACHDSSIPQATCIFFLFDRPSHIQATSCHFDMKAGNVIDMEGNGSQQRHLECKENMCKREKSSHTGWKAAVSGVGGRQLRPGIFGLHRSKQSTPVIPRAADWLTGKLWRVW